MQIIKNLLAEKGGDRNGHVRKKVSDLVVKSLLVERRVIEDADN